MGGFFGTISKKSCKADLFYGTDYNSHLGTRRAGMATYDEEVGIVRKIHSLESTYFRTKFEKELPRFSGNSGIGVISDTDPHPSASQTPSPEGKAIRCGGDGRTGSSAPTGAAENRRNGRRVHSAAADYFLISSQ